MWLLCKRSYDAKKEEGEEEGEDRKQKQRNEETEQEESREAADSSVALMVVVVSHGCSLSPDSRVQYVKPFMCWSYLIKCFSGKTVTQMRPRERTQLIRKSPS